MNDTCEGGFARGTAAGDLGKSGGSEGSMK